MSFLTAFFGWFLKDPRRVLFVLFSVAFGVASIWAVVENKRYKVLVVRMEEAQKTYEIELALRDAHIRTYQQTEKMLAEQMRKAAAELETARSQSATALANMKRDQGRANASMKAWADVYKRRPDSCKAALEAMESACSSLDKTY